MSCVSRCHSRSKAKTALTSFCRLYRPGVKILPETPKEGGTLHSRTARRCPNDENALSKLAHKVAAFRLFSPWPTVCSLQLLLQHERDVEFLVKFSDLGTKFFCLGLLLGLGLESPQPCCANGLLELLTSLVFYLLPVNMKVSCECEAE